MIKAKDQPFWAVQTMMDGKVLALLSEGHHVELLRAIMKGHFGPLVAQPLPMAVSFKEVSSQEFEVLRKKLTPKPSRIKGSVKRPKKGQGGGR
jgi:hypothetical protein